jgi:hypothetical protein
VFTIVGLAFPLSRWAIDRTRLKGLVSATSFACLIWWNIDSNASVSWAVTCTL